MRADDNSDRGASRSALVAKCLQRAKPQDDGQPGQSDFKPHQLAFSADEGGHTSGNTGASEVEPDNFGLDVSTTNQEGSWRARRGSNSRPIDSKSIALSN
jgi:hypothetical protein